MVKVTGKTYANSLKGHMKWSKDHPWNTDFQKEFHKIGDVFVELSISSWSNGDKACHSSIRVYDKEKKSFEVVDIKGYESLKAQVAKVTEAYAKKNDCKYTTYSMDW